MSHYRALVIGAGDDEALRRALAQFDEAASVPPYEGGDGRFDYYTIQSRIRSLASAVDIDQREMTYAVLTPDGQWRDRDVLDESGTLTGLVAAPEWEATWRELVGPYEGWPAYVVDLHQ